MQVTSLTGQVVVGQGANDRPQMEPGGLQPWSKAGIIIKENISQGSAYAAMMVTGTNGVRMQWDYVNDTPGLTGSVPVFSPRWLRLVRTGDTITGYDSADGARWTPVGTAALLAVATVLALAIGTIVRRGATAVAVVIVVTFVPYLLALVPPIGSGLGHSQGGLPLVAREWLLRVTPAAGFSVQAGSTSAFAGRRGQLHAELGVLPARAVGGVRGWSARGRPPP